jgi:hypothetical protein
VSAPFGLEDMGRGIARAITQNAVCTESTGEIDLASDYSSDIRWLIEDRR